MRMSRDKWLLFGGLLMIILGLVMLIAPEPFIQVFRVVIGIAVVLEGFVTLFSVRTEVADPRVRGMLLIRSLLGIVVGLVAVFLPMLVAKVSWTVMLYILAIEMIVSAVMEFFVAHDLCALDLPARDYIIEAILLIVLAVILFMFPKEIGMIVVRIAGVAVIIGGCVGLYRWKKFGV